MRNSHPSTYVMPHVVDIECNQVCWQAGVVQGVTCVKPLTKEDVPAEREVDVLMDANMGKLG